MTFNSGFHIFLYLISLIFIAMSITSPALAGCSCSVGNWDPTSFLNSELGSGQPVQTGSVEDGGAGAEGPQTKIDSQSERIAAFPGTNMLKSLKSVSSSDVVIDVSNGNIYEKSHIKNAIHIPSSDFLNGDGNLKADEQLAAILGGAGVSKNDSVVLYGSKQSSGEAEFAFLVMKYLGHVDLTVLDGSLSEWNMAGLPNETAQNTLPPVEYTPVIVADVIADYDYVKSGQAQIVDVRPFTEFGKGRVPGSIALDPSNVVKADRIKDKEDLSGVFSRLDEEVPVVVYSDDYARSSLVWYALQLMGYEASIYTWEDWKTHESTTERTITAADVNEAEGDTAGSKYTKLGTT